MTEAENEYVIRGNAAIVHCKIPSFVSDFVYIEAWVMDDGDILTVNSTNTDKGTFLKDQNHSKAPVHNFSSSIIIIFYIHKIITFT